MNYGLFLAKTVTIVAAVGVLLVLVVSVATRNKEEKDEQIELEKLNQRYDDIANSLKSTIAGEHEAKKLAKEQKAREKSEKKHGPDASRPRVYVLNFHGDIKASAVNSLREEVSAILMIARENDEVFLRLASPGGVVHGYGLAASQLQRIRDKSLPLTVSVDKVAASGGYMMACVANHIISAPFAILGSIGVVAEMPNFHRLLKKHDIDYELVTAGEHKRTLTVFGENTDGARAKFREDMEDVHALFKEFVIEHRPQVDIEKIATGEHWFGKRALDLKLVDEIKTSDDYLLERRHDADLYEITYTPKKTLTGKLARFFQAGFDTVLNSWWQRNQERYLP